MADFVGEGSQDSGNEDDNSPGNLLESNQRNQSDAERAAYIQKLVKKIRNGSEEKKTNRPVSKRPKTEKEGKRKCSNVTVGWLHRDSSEAKYKRVQLQCGGGMRRIDYVPDEGTVSHFLDNAKELFFPGGNSQKGMLSDMEVVLGDFQHEVIKSFKDREGKEVTFKDYLKSYGLFSGRTYLYLMTTGTSDQKSLPSISTPSSAESSGTSLSESQLPPLCTTNVATERELKSASVDSATSSASISESVFLPSSAQSGQSWTCTTEWINSQSIFIQYDFSSQSLYYDQEVCIYSFNRERCYEVACSNYPALLDTPLNEFQPPESNFTINHIAKGDNQYLVQTVQKDNPCDQFSCSPGACDRESSFEFPMANLDPSSIILHHPSDLWGFDDKQLILAVVSSHPNSSFYTWYRNGEEYKNGFNYCCLAVNEEGEYSVKVRCDGKEEVSKKVNVVKRGIFSSPSSFASKSNKHIFQDEKVLTKSESAEGSEAASNGVPFIDKKDLLYDPKTDEIGKGTFGSVYKATWAGTSVAVKHMKVRQMKLITNILKSEVQIHSKIRHPNIVQLMAVAIGKGAIYIVSELINGANLEDLLFSDEDDCRCHFTIPSDKKDFIGRQVVQAVVYLHNRKPTILHRDLKPANVLVAKESYVTKICDMGLGKLKSAHTTSHVTSTNVAGTPNYMSPECIVQKAKATTKADVWSLACTLLELFTAHDCWEQIGDNVDQPEENQESSYAILRCLRAKELPRAFEFFNHPNDQMKTILMKCFNYDASQRPDAIDLLGYFN